MRLRGGQPQRAAHARVLGDGDGVAGERQVDQVAGPVAGQPAHPQQLEVAAQLALADAEVGGDVGERDPGPGEQVGHEREQPGQPLGEAGTHPASAGPPGRARDRDPDPAARASAAGGDGRPRPADRGRQLRRVQHDDVRPVAGDPPGDRVQAAQVDLQLVAVPGPGQAQRPPDASQPAQAVRPARGDPQPGRADHRRQGDAAVDHREQVHPGRHLHGSRRAERRHRPRDPGQPEGADVHPVAVVAHQVPAAPRRDHPPRLHGPLRHLAGRAAAPVREGHHLTGLHGRQQRAERGLDGPDPRLHRPRARLVDLHPGRAQLEHRAVRRPRQPRGLPQAGGQRDRGRLVRLEVDLAQLVVVAGDAVAVGGVEPGVAAGLQGDAQLAQLGLVALEHPEERVVARDVGVAGARWRGSSRRAGTAGWTAGRAPGSPDARPGRRTPAHRTAAAGRPWPTCADPRPGRLILRQPVDRVPCPADSSCMSAAEGGENRVPAGDVQPLDGGEPRVPPPGRQRAAPRARRDRRPGGPATALLRSMGIEPGRNDESVTSPTVQDELAALRARYLGEK